MPVNSNTKPSPEAAVVRAARCSTALATCAVKSAMIVHPGVAGEQEPVDVGHLGAGLDERIVGELQQMDLLGHRRQPHPHSPAITRRQRPGEGVEFDPQHRETPMVVAAGHLKRLSRA
jgi:hypothetical protein